LQYAAAGLPVIASPIGVNERILAELGMPAPTTEGEWVDVIVDLLSRSTAARAALGRHARELVQLRYSYDAWLAQWEEAVGGANSLAPVPVDVSL
jgi:glycosyltransferase involved in cell wall biosynthesis